MLLTAAVIVAAVISSFGLPLFAGPTASIVLPSAAPSASSGPDAAQQGEAARVEITPDTVQSVIAALSRLDSYSRSVTVTLEGSSFTARVWVDAGWTRTDLSRPGRRGEHTIVGGGQVWRWYDGDSQAVSWDADHVSADVEGQHIPTYEDVLALDKRCITAAGYEVKNGFHCVYVQVFTPELEQTERYWVCDDNGLLIAAETVSGDSAVYSMAATAPEMPVSAAAGFTLPDGTLLHEAGKTDVTAPA